MRLRFKRAPTSPRTRSLTEWSFLYRRRNVLRAIRHRQLTLAAKQVMVHLSLLADDPFLLMERPDVAALARRLALAERTVRQAIAELVEHGLITFRHTGQPYRASDPSPQDPASRPDLAMESSFLAEAHGPLSYAEHIDMLHHLRERAVAARRIATAVQADRAEVLIRENRPTAACPQIKPGTGAPPRKSTGPGPAPRNRRAAAEARPEEQKRRGTDAPHPPRDRRAEQARRGTNAPHIPCLGSGNGCAGEQIRRRRTKRAEQMRRSVSVVPGHDQGGGTDAPRNRCAARSPLCPQGVGGGGPSAEFSSASSPPHPNPLPPLRGRRGLMLEEQMRRWSPTDDRLA